MSLDDLIATVKARGANEVEELLRAATAEAVALAQEANALRQQRLETVRARTHAALQLEASTIVAKARRESAAQVIGARGRAVERVWKVAQRMLSEGTARERWKTVIADHVRETLPFLDRENAVVVCARSNEKDVREALKRAKLSLVTQTKDGMGPGIIVTSADGRVFVDNTLLARLERLRNKILPEISSRLEAELSPKAGADPT